jgi:hypothetical protein
VPFVNVKAIAPSPGILAVALETVAFVGVNSTPSTRISESKSKDESSEELQAENNKKETNKRRNLFIFYFFIKIVNCMNLKVKTFHLERF